MAWTNTRARIAVGVRDGADEVTLTALRQQMRAERLADHIRKTVDAWPPLTQEQREHLAILLRPAADRGAVA